MYLDFCAGIDCVAEDCDVVDRGGEGVDVDLELSSRHQDNHSECRVGVLPPWRIGKAWNRSALTIAFRAPADPHAHFALWLNSTTHGEPKKMK